jgi:hypothetical protein
MNKTEAHALLDAARSGADIDRSAITEALRVTGDLGSGWVRPVFVEPGQPEGWDPEPREQRMIDRNMKHELRIAALEAA